MKPRISRQKNHGLTILEILVIMVCLFVLAAILLPVLASAKRRQPRISCVSNLKQVNLAMRIWEGDNNNFYPMGVSVTNGGGTELITTGNVAGCFQTLSNELSTPRILVCPEDWGRTAATNLQNDFNGSHISYFLSADVTNESHPQMILDGDDNFAISGTPVKSGLLQVSTNSSITWGPGRHGDVPLHYFWKPKPHIFYGNLGFADGSVAEESDLGLENALAFSTNGMPFPTNRWAIP